jgi:hypothetical protein
VVDFANGSVEGNNCIAMVCDVHDQVLAHDSQADEAKISTGLGLRS